MVAIFLQINSKSVERHKDRGHAKLMTASWVKQNLKARAGEAKFERLSLGRLRFNLIRIPLEGGGAIQWCESQESGQAKVRSNSATGPGLKEQPDNHCRERRRSIKSTAVTKARPALPGDEIVRASQWNGPGNPTQRNIQCGLG